jgi:hypothetical protein
MKRLTILSAFLAVLLCNSGSFGGDCRSEMDLAVETFWEEIFSVSRIERNYTTEERDSRCREIANKLPKTAQDLQIPTDDLEATLKEYLFYEGATREPPPGWDPNDRTGNLLMFSEMAHRKVRLDLALVSYGRRFCHKREN